MDDIKAPQANGKAPQANGKAPQANGTALQANGKATPQNGYQVSNCLQSLEREKSVTKVSDNYFEYFDSETANQKRKENAADMTKSYYDLATDFYEYGWGDSFHFSVYDKKDTMEQATKKTEYRLATKLGLVNGDKVLDMGCGIGGPARNIAKFTGSKITGLNISQHQIKRGTNLTNDAKLDHLINFVEGDFTKAPFENNTFDKIYAIEATCHCANLEDVYREAYRLLKPGGLFGLQEWCMTDKYDPSSKKHQAIKADILEGDSLPDLVLTSEAAAAMKNVGFELLEANDLALISEVPWYKCLQVKWSWSNFRMCATGRSMTSVLLKGLENVGVAPKGSSKVHNMLCKGADGLVKGGELGIFTPLYVMLGRKPLDAAA